MQCGYIIPFHNTFREINYTPIHKETFNSFTMMKFRFVNSLYGDTEIVDTYKLRSFLYSSKII